LSADTADYFQQTRTLCYVCTLIQSVHEERDHFQGKIGCADPFDGSDIERLECNGACAVSIVFHMQGCNLGLEVSIARRTFERSRSRGNLGKSRSRSRLVEVSLSCRSVYRKFFFTVFNIDIVSLKILSRTLRSANSLLCMMHAILKFVVHA